MHDKRVIVAVASTGIAIDKNMIKSIRGSNYEFLHSRFVLIVLISIIFHAALIFTVRSIILKPEETLVIEAIPDRFARLIIEKPIPKNENANIANTSQSSDLKDPENTPVESQPSKTTQVQQSKAQKSVEATVSRVEKKIRTVGVLGMLTGVGSTAKGPSVTDVLADIGDKTDNFGDLDKALEKMSGLTKAPDLKILDKKLVQSKDVTISHKEEIDDLIAGVGQATSIDLSKQGEFIIQRPESIEGAASSSAKRDNNAINEIVSSHKTSIRMTYEKYLRRDPSLAGKVTVRFTISASGSVTMAKVIENTTGNTGFETEILRKIRMWRFDPISEGDVTVSYPFVFTPAS